jgi:hypothetical protein|tara:strand:- start:9323 stop:9655 length:333 start_codon:yes stop_codon:yes gene_type:complete
MSAIYNKENLFKEFDIAKQKDIKLSKKKRQDDRENDIHKNRLKFCQEHLEFSKQSPQSYDADVNWENLVKAYSDPNPRDYFYKSVFNMTYAEKLADEAKKDNIDEDEDNK